MVTDFEEPFGQFLRRKIAEHGIRERQAALKIGATSGMMSNWVNGKRVPEPHNVEKLAALLAVDPNEMLTRAGHRPRRDTDPDPRRSELLELARQLPITEAELVSGFMRWRLSEAHRTR